jgi:hypothetical protein
MVLRKRQMKEHGGRDMCDLCEREHADKFHEQFDIKEGGEQ